MLAPTVKNVIYKHGKNAFSCRYYALNNSHLPSYELCFLAVRRFLPFCLPPGGRGTALAGEGACVLKKPSLKENL